VIDGLVRGVHGTASAIPTARARSNLASVTRSAYYGAPPGWIGRRLRVQWDGARVRLLDPATGQLLREHLRQDRGRHGIHPDDAPSRTPATTVQPLHRARHVGRHIGALCDQIHRTDREIGVKRILGVLSLARKHGAPTVEEAAKAAIDLGPPSYRFLRRYLERRPAAPLTLRQVDPLIRQCPFTEPRQTRERQQPDKQPQSRRPSAFSSLPVIPPLASSQLTQLA
jgi:hypothetical protein